MTRVVNEDEAKRAKVVADACGVALEQVVPPSELVLAIAYALDDQSGVVGGMAQGGIYHLAVVRGVRYMEDAYGG